MHSEPIKTTGEDEPNENPEDMKKKSRIIITGISLLCALFLWVCILVLKSDL